MNRKYEWRHNSHNAWELFIHCSPTSWTKMALILTVDDEYTVGVDELEAAPDDTRNSIYFEMYKYGIRGFLPYQQS